MQLVLELQNNEIFFQQNIPVMIRLEDCPQGIHIPLSVTSTDVLSFELYDELGKIVSRGDGYTAVENRGRKTRRIAQELLPNKEIQTKGTIEFKEELLRYLEIKNSGNYTLKAFFKYKPDGINLTSNEIIIKVKKNVCTWFDFIDSESLMFFVQHNSECLIGRVSSLQKTLGFRKGCSCSLPKLSLGTFSDVDFMVRPGDTAHNYYRWILFQTESGISACTFDGNSFSIMKEPEVPLSGKLIGRPIQHEDYSLSVFLLNNKNDIHVLTYDKDLKPLKDTLLTSLDYKTQLISSATDLSGKSYIAYGVDKGFPVTLEIFEKGTLIASETVINEKDLPFLKKSKSGSVKVSVLWLNASVKNQNSMALLALLLAEDEWSKKMYMVRIPLPLSQETIPQVVEYAIGGLLIQSNENLVSGHIVQDNKGIMHAIAFSTYGNVIYSQSAVYPKLILESGSFPDGCHPRLLVTLRGDIHMVYADRDLGIGQKILHQVPKR